MEREQLLCHPQQVKGDWVSSQTPAWIIYSWETDVWYSSEDLQRNKHRTCWRQNGDCAKFTGERVQILREPDCIKSLTKLTEHKYEMIIMGVFQTRGIKQASKGCFVFECHNKERWSVILPELKLYSITYNLFDFTSLIQIVGCCLIKHKMHTLLKACCGMALRNWLRNVFHSAHTTNFTTQLL